MDAPDWSDVGGAVAALVVVLLPLLLARWLIGRNGDDEDDEDDQTARPATHSTDSAPPHVRSVRVSRTRTRS